MYVYLVEFYVVNSDDVRFDRGAEIYDSWDKAFKAIHEFKNENIKQGYLVSYDIIRKNDTRQVELEDIENYLYYHAGINKFEVK